MNPSVRKKYNQDFTAERYQKLVKHINQQFQYTPPFRIAETPVFVPGDLKQKLVDACDEIMDVIAKPNFKELTEGSFKDQRFIVPGEDQQTRFLQMDFGICKDGNGDLTPQLIELQGFPSLYFFQDMLAQAYRQNFDIPEQLTHHIYGMTTEEYVEKLRKVIVGDHDPKTVVMLEVEPTKQHTYIDFLATEHHLGIKVLCLSDLIKRGKCLFYKNEKGQEVRISRIYNRVIFDELFQRKDLKREFYFHDEVDVDWVGHPAWFFRISKYTMPLFKSQYVPECHYLSSHNNYPLDLENYVLKPLYSFAGSGVKLDITKEELQAIKDPENYILQRKVSYEPVVETPNEPVKGEIRILMLWEEGKPRAEIINNLVRLSKGKMVGVKYNKDKDWVGASVGFF